MNKRDLVVRSLQLVVVCSALFSGTVLVAQEDGPMQPPSRPLVKRPDTPAGEHAVTLASGTKIPLVLKHAITTKTAREGDPIYAQTNFPVVIDNEIVVPAGSYVQGVVTRVQRAGRVKGRAEILVHFRTLIFPSGYTLSLTGGVDNAPDAESGRVKDKEGTIQADGTKGKDMKTIGKAAGYGGLAGVAVGSAKGSPLGGGAIGGGAGAAAGLAAVLLTRGPDLRLEAGSTIETALERPLVIDLTRARAPSKWSNPVNGEALSQTAPQ